MKKFEVLKYIDSSDWDKLVRKVYGKQYCYQQQDDCRDRGSYEVYPTSEDDAEFTTIDSMKIECNGDDMGVTFDLWLNTPADYFTSNKLTIEENGYSWDELWWERNFYPSANVIARDLQDKGLLEEGSFTIIVDW